LALIIISSNTIYIIYLNFEVKCGGLFVVSIISVIFLKQNDKRCAQMFVINAQECLDTFSTTEKFASVN